ncbi:succinate dehydrogenase, cytochrome b556 subunit [Francisella philomiragia]|uniref:succinate dehydrogenase, cytochrome b556 subunit n=1 Tax=Francisella philomiragia TaxID=28110 RepID=UPI001905FB80|nr:succinate dehydrogenase, cytochrome b556 subunit [Francisella philomiragia]MBK2093073.1 succinate dehydrogenase, cytochrome b556 subunit [Francisella philomiragia]MBK2256801.1 succinate dehydrogenase, cytochrome b556 subunit [Francisella philomiragia]MBK2269459.1 succinate dehydrogenase, cytochrome b556 subunit [Francisella philomiragia]MBK2271176.1 succinate dehydrogenase, cytochrome b556 subunit [Francisella philomiragia]MBK2274956.1 succinate dehydrogenase, cytochrome b556 subunit [Franc
MKKITNVDLMSIKSYKFPITAISSILHRISGVVLIFAIPLAVVGMNYTLAGPDGYQQTVAVLTRGWCSIFFWLFLSSITYHVFAGVRHMIMDMGFGESMKAAKITSLLVIILGVLSAILWGCYLWL